MINHTDCVKSFHEAQDDEYDIRENCREQELALKARGGQWEASVWAQTVSRPRFQIDLMFPLVNAIATKMDKSRFDIKTIPASGDASKKVANTYDGIIRHIENKSEAQVVYNTMGRSIVESGISGLRVDLKFENSYNFDKDLLINYIPNFKDRVWFDPGADDQTKDSAEWVMVLTPTLRSKYEKKYPEGSGQSLNQNILSNYYYYKPDYIIIGEYFWKEKESVELVQMSNGMVLKRDDTFEFTVEKLKDFGVTEIDERKAEVDVVYKRMMDGDDFLDTSKEKTVFKRLPIIPCYGNYSVIEDKQVYFGEPEKLLDVQRVFNYTVSRLTEDTSLRPKTKLIITKAQAKGHKAEYSTMNVDNKPVLHYNHFDGIPPPYFATPPPPDPTLITITNAMREYVNTVAGVFSSNMGENPGLQSGIALEQQIEEGSDGIFRYFFARQIAMVQVAKVLVDTIPEVYGERQQMRILGTDNKAEYIDLNETVTDPETGEEKLVYDFSVGQYDLVCTVGPGEHNQQKKTIDTILKIAERDPEVLPMLRHIIFKNITAPGMDEAAQIFRQIALNQGMIPEDSMSEEEKQQQAQRMEQSQQPSPQDQSAIEFAQAETKRVKAETAEVISKGQERAEKTQLDKAKIMLEFQKLAMQKTDTESQTAIDMRKLPSEIDNLDANTLNMVKDSMGAFAVINPNAVRAYNQKARDLITDEGNSDPIETEVVVNLPQQNNQQGEER